MTDHAKMLEEYEKTEFYIQSSNLIKMIENKYEDYFHLEELKKETVNKTLEENNNILYCEILKKMNELKEDKIELQVINNMSKFLSDSNCWWFLKKVSEIVHRIYLEFYNLD